MMMTFWKRCEDVRELDQTSFFFTLSVFKFSLYDIRRGGEGGEGRERNGMVVVWIFMMLGRVEGGASR